MVICSIQVRDLMQITFICFTEVTLMTSGSAAQHFFFFFFFFFFRDNFRRVIQVYDWPPFFNKKYMNGPIFLDSALDTLSLLLCKSAAAGVSPFATAPFFFFFFFCFVLFQQHIFWTNHKNWEDSNGNPKHTFTTKIELKATSVHGNSLKDDDCWPEPIP